MGNFGKRILFVFLSVALVVAIAVVGNSFEQKSKNHSVKNSAEIVYSGVYNGQTYEVSKNDIWNNILHSSPMSTVNEMIDKQLLKPVMDTITDNDVLTDKVNELVYGTTDQEQIEEYNKDAENVDKLWKKFSDNAFVLGLVDETFTSSVRDYANFPDSLKEYIKLNVAYDMYATYRMENGLKVGSADFSTLLTDKLVKEEYNKKYSDTLALTIKFYSEKDAESYLKDFNSRLGYKLVNQSSALKMYVGDSIWVLAKNDNKDNYLNDDLTPAALTQVITKADSTEVEVKVPRGNILSKNDKFVWATDSDLAEGQEYEGYTLVQIEEDGTINYSVTEGWVINSKATTFNFSKVDFDGVTSFTTSNTAPLSGDQFLKVMTLMYNDFYSQQREAVSGLVDTDDIINAFLDSSKVNESIKKYGFVLVGSEIRRYVGNEENVIEIIDGEAQAKAGFPVFKKFLSNNKEIPNFKIKLDEDGDPILDSEKRYIYVLDEAGNKIPNDSKKDIMDQTTFDKTNTIKATSQQLYSIYVQLYKDYKDLLTEAYINEVSRYEDNITYNYDELAASRSDLADKIFKSLTYNVNEKGAYLASYSSFKGVKDSETPYYLIYKLSSSVKDANPSDEELASVKKEMMNSYLKTTGFVQMAAAELRAEAGLKLYDEFMGYEYEAIIATNSDSNKHGVAEDKYEEYFKVKGYRKFDLAETKAVKVLDKTVDAIKVTTDDLYEYAMKYNSAIYVSNAALTNISFNLAQYEAIHGEEDNYLKSKNWKMMSYAETCQYYNYYYEYYKSMYMQYGYNYDQSINEFLYQYGARSFKDLVESLKRSTMKTVLLYEYLVGELNSHELSEYTKGLVNSTMFNKLYDEYYNINVKHVLIYVDYDEDGTPDDFKEFYNSLEDGSVKIKDETGATLTTAKFDRYLNELQTAIMSSIYQDQSFSSSNTDALKAFVKEYNESSRVDSKYKDYKKAGLALMFEELGEVTNETASSFVKDFKETLKTISEKLYRVDGDLVGYTLSDDLTMTEFGYHFIYATKGSKYTKPSFKFNNDNNKYLEGFKNNSDSISQSQIGLFLQEDMYSNIYGSTDNPMENAGFEYPNVPKDISEAISTVFGNYMSAIMGTNNSYHINYLIVNSLINDTTSSNLNEYKDRFIKLSSIYEDLLFESFK